MYQVVEDPMALNCDRLDRLPPAAEGLSTIQVAEHVAVQVPVEVAREVPVLGGLLPE